MVKAIIETIKELFAPEKALSRDEVIRRFNQ